MSEEVYAPIIDPCFTITDALKQVFAISNANKTSSKGFNQVSKAVLGKKAMFVLIAKDYDETRAAIIRKLCSDSSIPVIEIESRLSLGSIVGFVKPTKDGGESVSACGVAAMLDFVYETDSKYFVQNYLRDSA